MTDDDDLEPMVDDGIELDMTRYPTLVDRMELTRHLTVTVDMDGVARAIDTRDGTMVPVIEPEVDGG